MLSLLFAAAIEGLANDGLKEQPSPTFQRFKSSDRTEARYN